MGNNSGKTGGKPHKERPPQAKGKKSPPGFSGGSSPSQTATPGELSPREDLVVCERQFIAVSYVLGLVSDNTLCSCWGDVEVVNDITCMKTMFQP